MRYGDTFMRLDKLTKLSEKYLFNQGDSRGGALLKKKKRKKAKK